MNQLSFFPAEQPAPWPGVMLLESYFPGDRDYPVLVEPKLDGFRGVVIVRGGQALAWSREGRRMPAGDELAGRWAPIGDGVVDGEFFAGSWGRTASVVQSKRPSPLLHFVAFDFLTLDEWAAGESLVPTSERMDRVTVPAGCERVERRTARNDGEIWNLLFEYLQMGMEGIVIKAPASPYLCGHRPVAWQKLKPGNRDEW